MKTLAFLVLILFFPAIVSAQFEQKLSINIGSGIFQTLGKKHDSGDIFQMANYKAGISENIGIQFNINRRLSILAEVGFLHSGKWAYGTELQYYIEDPFNSGVYLAIGYNTLNLSNISIGAKPKVFLNPGKKWNPYLFLGLSLNFTHAAYEDNFWKSGKALYDQGKLPDFLDPINGYPNPYDPWLEKNTGLGFNPGAGLEYNLSDKIGFSVSAGYNLILLNGKNFKNDKIIENLNSVIAQVGIRFNFLKSKKL